MDLTEKKQILLQAWKQVLGVNGVNDEDNFFALGGDTAKGVALAAVLAQRGLKLDMLNLYTSPTLSEMSESLEEMPAVFSGNFGAVQNFPPVSGMNFSPSIYAPIFVQNAYVVLPQPVSQQNKPFSEASSDISSDFQIQRPPLGKVTKSPEDALDSVLSNIFPNGYDREGNLFENGMDSVIVAQIIVSCAAEGYRIEMTDIFEDPTFAGIVANMKTE